MTALTLCSRRRLCLCAVVLAAGSYVEAAARNSTQEVLDNIHAPGTTGTPVSDFTTDTNYTAITQIISSTPALTGDTNALAELIAAVSNFLVGAPEAWNIAPLFGHAIATASVPGPVQSQAYAKALANNADLQFLLDCAEPQVDQGAFTYEQVFSQAKSLGVPVTKIPASLPIDRDLSAILDPATPFGAANSVWGATPETLTQASGNIGQVAQLLSGTARLASYQETTQGTRNSTRDKAVTDSIVEAVQQAKLSSMMQAAAFASAINSSLIEQQQEDQTGNVNFDEEPVALLIDAASQLNQSTATLQGLTRARSAGFNLTTLCEQINSTNSLDSAAASIIQAVTGTQCG